MSFPTNATRVYSNYDTYFEPEILSPQIGFTKQQKYFEKQVLGEVAEIVALQYPPKQWVARIALACIEVIHGKRSVNQMRKICSNRVSQDLLIKQSVLSGKKTWNSVRILKINFSPGIKDSVEVTINFEYGERIYPMAMNLNQTKDGWRINACEIGPH
jgi:hypothetical protein